VSIATVVKAKTRRQSVSIATVVKAKTSRQ